MLDRRWLHGGRRLTVAAGITGSDPTLLRAWTSNPWSFPNHFSPLSVKGIVELKKNEIPEILTPHRRRQLMILRLSVGWTIFGVIDLRVVGKFWKGKQYSQRKPAKNPPMAKLVFFVIPNVKEVSEWISSCKSVLLLHAHRTIVSSSQGFRK